MSKVEDFDKINKMIKEIREKFPNFVIMTATQASRPSYSTPNFDIGETNNVIIIDYINLIK